MKLKFLLVCASGISLAQNASAQWALNGNAGTNPAVNFVGTTDNQALRFRTNNGERMTILTNGRVGIGTMAPQSTLDVYVPNSNVQLGVRSDSGNAVFFLDKKHTGDYNTVSYRTAGVPFWQTGSITNDNFQIKNMTLGIPTITCLTLNNFVGVGTNVPAERLDVNGNIRASGNVTAVGTVNALGGNSNNWNTAFSWGNHALAGYLTAETDPQVGVITNSYVPVWNGAALVTSGIYNSGSYAGLGTTSMVGSASFTVQSPNTSGYGGMSVNQTGTGCKPFYSYGINGSPSCWTYYDQTTSNFNIYNGGDRLTVDAAGQVGIGTTAPGYYLDIQASNTYRALNASSSFVGSVGQIVNFERTSAPSSANDILQLTVPAGSPADFQFIEADIAASNRFQVNGDGSTAVGGSNITTARLNVIGGNPQNTKLYGIYASTDSASSSSRAIFAEQTNGTVDGVGLYGKAAVSAGNGYGVIGEGGYRGVYGLASSTTYTGTSYGVFGNATGSTAGTRIGVYGVASGGTTAESNWGGYFPTKVYATQIRVGTTGGATGYIACIGGKLIAEEVRVELQASWPDYVFNSNYKMLPLTELEGYVKNYNHLPNVPSACEIEENGLLLGKMQGKMMEKIEESTLYIIQLKKEIDELKIKMAAMESAHK